jgi:hypothetical protein
MPDQPPPGFPETIPHSTRSPSPVYRRVPEAYAIVGHLPPSLATSVVGRIEDSRVVFVQGVRDPDLLPDGATPLYALRPGGALAMPTGRVLARFAPGDPVEQHEAQLERAGYRIIETITQAPEAAWLEDSAGNPANALARFTALANVPGLVHAEPQMISPSHHR